MCSPHLSCWAYISKFISIFINSCGFILFGSNWSHTPFVTHPDCGCTSPAGPQSRSSQSKLHLSQYSTAPTQIDIDWAHWFSMLTISIAQYSFCSLLPCHHTLFTSDYLNWLLCCPSPCFLSCCHPNHPESASRSHRALSAAALALWTTSALLMKIHQPFSIYHLKHPSPHLFPSSALRFTLIAAWLLTAFLSGSHLALHIVSGVSELWLRHSMCFWYECSSPAPAPLSFS